jgi:hypothetical protein
MRLYLPGEECAYELVSGSLTPGSGTTTTTVAAETAAAEPPGGGVEPGTPGESTTVPTTVPLVIQLLPDQTTIAPTVLDPKAPLPTVDLKTTVLTCSKLPAGIVVKQPKP